MILCKQGHLCVTFLRFSHLHKFKSRNLSYFPEKQKHLVELFKVCERAMGIGYGKNLVE